MSTVAKSDVGSVRTHRRVLGSNHYYTQAEQAEDRPRWRQGLVVRAWLARTSLVIQREQCRSVARMVDRATRKTHGEIPRKHRPMCTDDHDCAQVAQPLLEVE